MVRFGISFSFINYQDSSVEAGEVDIGDEYYQREFRGNLYPLHISIGYDFPVSVSRMLNEYTKIFLEVLGIKSKKDLINIPILNRAVPFVYYGLGAYIRDGYYDYYRAGNILSHHILYIYRIEHYTQRSYVGPIATIQQQELLL